MEYTNLGKSGLKVSRLCLGCMSFGVPERGTHPWTLNEVRSRPLIARALELGFNFFDTSNSYSDGTSEEITGRALRDFSQRDAVVIATKVFYPLRKDPNGRGLSRKAIMTEVDASLRRLGTDYIDLYQIHRWDYRTPIEETLEALHDVVKAGKARYLGASSMYAWQFCQALYLADRHGWTRFVSMQNHYNLLYREEEREMLRLCAAEGIGVVPWSPLARGKLTRPWEDEPSTQRAATDEFGKTLYTSTVAADRQVVERVGAVADALGVPRAAAALAWLLARPVVTSPIVGVTRPEHLEDAVGALALKLSAEEMADLEAPYVPHPVVGFEQEPMMTSGPQAAAPENAATDVVIVGSGPTGLMAAALLVRCGLKVRILDKGEQQAHESRAFGVQPKSLELMLSIGLADEFLKRGFIASGAQIFVDGKQVGQINVDDIGRPDSPYSFILMVPQWDIEGILVEDLERHGVLVEHNVEVTGFEQSPEGVTVAAKNKSGATSQARAAYVIGADGAHSIVRKTLGLRYDGAPYPQQFLLADCKIDWSLDYDHLKFFVRGRDLAIYLPLQGKDLCRIVAIKPQGPEATAQTAEAGGSEPATLEEVQQVVSDASGLDIKLRDASWVSGYRIHHRGVNKYGQGRAFVAGDAAHIHSPAGGQGMNTGLQDAANLAWKLAMVLKGHAPPALLDTYNAERWPVGQKVLNFTDRLFAGVSTQSVWATKLRNIIVPLAAATVAHSGTLRARAFHFVSQLGIRYEKNDFVLDDASPQAPRAWRQGLTAGHRAPDGLIARNLDVFSLIGGYRFHVLALSRSPLSRSEIEQLLADLAVLPKSIGLDLETHVVAHSLLGRDERIVRAENNQVFNNYGVTHETPRALFLIRPDGYIAYRSDRFDVAGLTDFLKRFAQGPSGNQGKN